MNKKINTSKDKVEYYKGTSLEEFNKTVAPTPNRKKISKNVNQMSEQL